MKQIARMTFGSHLYGTNTPASDRDFKGVHLPSAREMLLHQTQGSFSERTKEDRTAKNTADDIDFESFALHKWFGMLAKGDANALEMLFAPRDALLFWSEEWLAIQERRDRFVSLSFVEGFVSYMKRQAAKYGIKGSRMGTVRAALALIDGWISVYGKERKLVFFQEAIEAFSEANAHSGIISIKHPNGPEQLHWEVVGRKFPLGVHVGEVRRVLQSVFDNYGARTRAAEQSDGVDWKAMSHAIRVGGQALELMREGTLTFPRADPEAPRWRERVLRLRLAGQPLGHRPGGRRQPSPQEGGRPHRRVLEQGRPVPVPGLPGGAHGPALLLGRLTSP
ncbi:DNA polymerase beta superfamily protein [Methylobacterium currus]|nr:nucleotidyltransferase domain-containing protein [Methylobacterium currus]